MPSYAVIIPSKTDSNLIPCLTALRKHEPSCPIVVVDDGLSLQAIDQARFCEPIHIARGVRPFVFARNVNGGIKAADIAFGNHRWFPGRPALDGYCILNDDALLESPRGFELLAWCCEKDPSIGCIGATTNLTGQPLQQRQTITTQRAYGAPEDMMLGMVGLRIVPHIAFVCVYIPRRTLDLLAEKAPADWRFTSGLDERYTAYGSDDLDFCMQVEAAGLKVAVHDGCFVNHSKLHSSYRGAPETPGDIWPNHRLLRAKWGIPPNPMDPEFGKQMDVGLEWPDPQQGGAR